MRCDKCELSAATRASPSSLREPKYSVPMRAKHVQRDIDTKGLSVHLLSTCGALPLTSAVGTESAESDEEHLFERASDSSRAAKRRRGPDAIACDGGEHRRRPRRPRRAWRSTFKSAFKRAPKIGDLRDYAGFGSLTPKELCFENGVCTVLNTIPNTV